MTENREEVTDYQLARTSISLNREDWERIELIREVARKHWPVTIRITDTGLIRWALQLVVAKMQDEGLINAP